MTGPCGTPGYGCPSIRSFHDRLLQRFMDVGFVGTGHRCTLDPSFQLSRQARQLEQVATGHSKSVVLDRTLDIRHNHVLPLPLRKYLGGTSASRHSIFVTGMSKRFYLKR
jgi:hypothetical protein